MNHFAQLFMLVWAIGLAACQLSALFSVGTALGDSLLVFIILAQVTATSGPLVHALYLGRPAIYWSAVRKLTKTFQFCLPITATTFIMPKHCVVRRHWLQVAR